MNDRSQTPAAADRVATLLARLPGVFESSDFGAALVAESSRLLEVNGRLCQMLGYSREELLGKSWAEICAPGASERDLAERPYRRKDGSVGWACVSVAALRGPSEPSGESVLIIHDVSERRWAEERLRAAMDASRDGYWERDLRTGRVFHSSRMNEMVGRPAVDEVVPDEAWRERIHPDDARELAPRYQAVLTGREDRVDATYRVRCEDGSWKWIHSRGRAVERDGSGRATRIAGTVTDVSLQKAAELAYAVQERRLAEVFEGASDGYFEDDLVRGTRFRSPRTNVLLGLPPHSTEVGRDAWTQLVHPEDMPGVIAATTPVMAGLADRGEFTCRARMPDGSWRWRLVRLWVGDRQANGKPARTFGTVIDIDKLMTAEAALRASEGQYRALVETSSDGIATLRDGMIEYANPAAAGILGLESARALVGHALVEFVDPGRWTEVAGPVAEMMAGRSATPLALSLRRGDGGAVEVLAMPAVFRDAKGPAVRLVIRDLTEDRRAATLLMERKWLVEAILASSMDGVFFLDGEGRFTELNDEACAMAGYSRAELERMGVRDIAVPEDAREIGERIGAALAEGSIRFESRIRRKDGAIRDVELSLQILADGKGSVVTFMRDITDRKAAQAALRESEERFRTLAEGAPVGIFVSGLDGGAAYMNPALRAMYGLTEADSAGRAWMASVHPDDREAFVRAMEEAVVRRGNFDCGFRIARHAGDTLRVQAYASPMQGSSGELRGYVGVVVDVTEQKRVEQQLAVASRLSALGTLVAGVGHEINNPLAAIMAGEGFVLDVQRDLLARLGSAVPPTMAEIFSEVEGTIEPLVDGLASGERIAQIVKDLAIFAGSRAVRERVRLLDVVEAGLRWLPASIGKAAQVEVVDLGAPDVVALPGQLSQVVLNLVTNAFRAASDGKDPRVTVRLRAGAAGHAVLEVVDDGIGMEPEMLERIFDPFFTTRPAGDQRGVGLGLSLCQAIVSAHGGTITVKSEPGNGSTFTVELPGAPTS